jgi:hypothetical protein
MGNRIKGRVFYCAEPIPAFLAGIVNGAIPSSDDLTFGVTTLTIHWI